MRYPALGITLSVVESLFSNQAICREFPFIRYAQSAWYAGSARKSGCSSCGGGAVSREHRHHLLETVKAGIVSLPPERLKLLKDLLGADKLVLHFSVRGQTVTKEI